jgi:hypothetical protein
MTIIANVMWWPAFETAYVSAVMFPALVITSLVVEFLVVFRLERKIAFWRTALFLLFANAASGAIGVRLANLMPTGLIPRMVDEGGSRFEAMVPGPSYGAYIALGAVLAFMLSVLVEYGIAKGLRRCLPFKKPFTTLAIANAASNVAFVLLALTAWGMA